MKTKSAARLSVLFACVLYVSFLPWANAQSVSSSGDVSPTQDPNPSPSWHAGSSLFVGEHEQGSLLVAGGGAVSNAWGYIGYSPESQGSVTVTGAGSAWTNTQGLLVGAGGTGALTILNGGSVSSSAGTLGVWGAGSHGTVTVTGVGSQWTTGTLEIGAEGTGSLLVTAGGVVSANGTKSIGQGSSVTVTGAGSSWSGNGSLSLFGYESPASLLVAAGGSVSNSSGFVDQGMVTVTGTGSQWHNSAGLYVGNYGAGSLLVEAGASVSNTGGAYIGYNSGDKGHVTITGEGSQWTNGGILRVGFDGSGSLLVEAGASVSNTTATIGAATGSDGSVVVTGPGSLWANTGDLILGGSSLISPSSSTGTLTIEDGGTVSVEGSLKIWHGDTVSLHVTNNGMLQVGGNVGNEGLIRLTAGPSLTAGTYTPIEAEGSWSGTGAFETIGGIWNASTHEFTIAEAQSAASGVESTVDLASTQRLEVTGSTGQALLAFNSGAEAIGGGSTITFSATENGVEYIDGQVVLAAWNFETDLAFGTEIQLSLQIGTGWNPGLLSVWHSADGFVWTPFATEILYEGSMASFFVEGFSSYAISGVPEPGTSLLIGLGLAALLLRHRRARVMP